MTPLPANQTATQTPTLLIVDDQQRVRHALRDWLKIMFPHFNCLEVSTGELAVVICGVQKPDLVLMDLHLSQMSGIEATRRIKKTTPQIKVVMITSYEDPAYQQDSLEAGASAFVHKREMTTALVPIIKELLSPAPPGTVNEKQP